MLHDSITAFETEHLRRCRAPKNALGDMSAMGHKQTSRDVRVMSALPPRADISSLAADFRHVP